MQTTDIRYAPTVPSQVQAAKLLLDYFPDARLVPDPLASGAIILVLGANFAGEITVPTTTTTTLAPGTEAPATTLPPTPTDRAATHEHDARARLRLLTPALGARGSALRPSRAQGSALARSRCRSSRRFAPTLAQCQRRLR